MDERIRMDTAGGSDGQRRPGGTPRPTVMVTVAAVVTAFGLLTTLAPDRDALEPETIEPAALVEPRSDAGFRVVGELAAGPWENFRIAGAYLYTGDAPTPAMGDSPTVITDEDEILDVDLPDVEVLFGAIDAGGESVAFGRTPSGPAVWRSNDNVAWELEMLPWDGTVRAAAHIDGRLVLIGISKTGPAFTYVAATEAPHGWLVVETTRVPDSGLISVPGGFVGRGNATDGSGYGYLYSDNGVDWSWQADRAAAGSRSLGQLPGFVIEGDTAALLTLPGDDRVFKPPAWPVSGLWLEGETIWVQTPNSAWATVDGVEWSEYPIDAETGIDGGYTVLLPVGDAARVATSVDAPFALRHDPSDDRIVLLRWNPGSG